MSHRAHRLFEVPEDRGPLNLTAIAPPELAAATHFAMPAFRRGEESSTAPRDLRFLRAGRPTQYTVTPPRLQRMRRRSRVADEIIVGCVTARDMTLARD